LAAAGLALVVGVVQLRNALQEARNDAQAVERGLLEQVTAGLPLSQIQRNLQIASAANDLNLALVVNQHGVVIASNNAAFIGERFERRQLAEVDDNVWKAIWPCIPGSRSWWIHPACRPPLIRTSGPWPLVGGEQLVSLARTPLAISHQSGLEEGGLLITSLDLRSTLQQAALAGGLIVLAGLVLLVGTGGALVLLVRQQLMRRLVTLTRTDSLTGLLNRDAWLETVAPWLGEQEAARTTVVIAIAGLDRFKDLNARHGYLAGDRVLKTLSRDLQGLMREGEWLARLSGDQFGLVLLGGTEQADRLRGLCEALAAEPLVVEPGHTTRITLSVGMTSSSSPAGWELNALLAHADRNLRAAKNLGGNQVMNA